MEILILIAMGFVFGIVPIIVCGKMDKAEKNASKLNDQSKSWH